MRKIALILTVLVFAAGAALRLAAPRQPLLEDIPFGGVATDACGDILRIALAADGRYRLRAGLDAIAPQAVDAALAYEDKYFFSHPGINVISLARGALSLLGGRRMGGSTITMQVARLRYGLKTSCLAGKFQQIWLALAMEMSFSKTEILEAYFNLAPYGGNVEGIEAASRIYFHKSAAMLTRREAEALAVIPQNPAMRKPGSGTQFDEARLRVFGAAHAAPLKIHGAGDLPFRAPHLCMEILANGPGRRNAAIERDLQGLLERAIASFAARGKPQGLNNAAALLVRCKDMNVVALAGSAAYANAAISGQIDGTRARRSPGSTLKPFIYALALDQGLIHPHTILADSPKSFGGYDPENFDGSFRGPVPAHEALKASRNLPAIALAEQLRAPGLYGFLRKAGIQLPHGPEHYGLALVLGGAELTMRQLAALYAMLANQGLWRPIQLLRDGAKPPPVRLLSPEAAWLALHMLRREEAQVNGTGIYYKTGTSNGLRDAWTAGIAGDYVLVVWAGNFDNSSNPALVGAAAALPLFEEIATALAALRPMTDKFAQPPPGLNLARARVCATSGDFFRSQCAETAEIWYIPGVSPVRDTGIFRKILVDRATGLRACDAADAEEVWHEFWPADMKRIFAQAGIFRPDPPPWLPQCAGANMAPGIGKKPRILLPKRNVEYQRRIIDTGFRLPLQAAADADAGKIHWYAGQSYVGSAESGETIFWHAPAGEHELMAVDEAGRVARQRCRVALLP